MAKYVGAQPRVSGNRIDGGTITTFQSTGIDDTASTQTNLTITDSQATLDPILVNTATTGSHTFDTDTLVIDTSNDRIGINVASPTAVIDANGFQQIITWDDGGATAGPDISLIRHSPSPANNDMLGCIRFYGHDSLGNDTVFAKINTKIVDVTDGTETGEIDLVVAHNGSEYSIVKASGNQLVINDDQHDTDLIIRAVNNTEMMHIDMSAARIGIGTATPTETLHVVGDVKIDGTIVFSNQASGSGAATFVIQDEIDSGDNAYAALELQDSTALNMAQFALSGGKLHITGQHSTDGSAGIHFGIGYTTDAGEDYEYMMMLEEETAETTISSANTSISFDNTTGKILSGTSGFFSSNYSVGDIVLIEGATNSANNRSWRIQAFADTGGSVVVIDRRGNKPTTESAGASINVKKHKNMVMIPNTVNHYTWTAPQSTNSDIVASTSYVRTAIANLIDSSPAALDTLDELAAALGDDANFATTIANNLAGKVNLDFDNLSATGEEALYDYIGSMVTGSSQTMEGTGNTVSLTHNDANNQIDIAIVLNDPTLGVTMTGDVTGNATAVMTNLQDTTVTITNMAIANGVIGASALDATGSVTNIVNGLPRATSVQNADDLIIADASDGFALKKLARSLVAPPAMAEDLGFFALAMA